MDGFTTSAAQPSQASAAAPWPPTARPRLTNAQLRVIRLSVARTCTEAEFDHFIAVAERAGLDPLRRQISALVLNPADPDKRAMLPLATIDGLRAIAARHGDYRPMEGAPILEIDPDRREPRTNPLGIVRAEVTLWRKFDGSWFPITGEAWWDEYAVLIGQPGAAPSESDEAHAQPDRHRSAPAHPGEGEPAPPRVMALAARWRRMGRVMLAKCAEAQALRRGWPEDLSGLYGEEELQRAEVEDLLAHERADRATEGIRQRMLAGGRSLALCFQAGGPLEPIAREDIGQRLAAFIATAADAAEIESFQLRNRDALRIFWDWAPGDALDIKAQAERAIARFNGKLSHAPRPAVTRDRAPSRTPPRAPASAGADGPVRKPSRRPRGRAPVPATPHQSDQEPAA